MKTDLQNDVSCVEAHGYPAMNDATYYYADRVFRERHGAISPAYASIFSMVELLNDCTINHYLVGRRIK